MSDGDRTGERLELEGLPPELLGRELSRWMGGIDAAFEKASDSEKIWGHVAALTASMRLLKQLPGFDSEMTALKDLQARLEKLTVGQKRPILAIIDAVKTPGRPPESFTDHIREVRAVALAQFAIDQGWSEPDAYALVAKELARVGVEGRRGGLVTAATVKGWREGKIKANDEVFKLAMATFAEFAPTTLSGSAMRKLARDLISAGEPISTNPPS